MTSPDWPSDLDLRVERLELFQAEVTSRLFEFAAQLGDANQAIRDQTRVNQQMLGVMQRIHSAITRKRTRRGRKHER